MPKTLAKGVHSTAWGSNQSVDLGEQQRAGKVRREKFEKQIKPIFKNKCRAKSVQLIVMFTPKVLARQPAWIQFAMFFIYSPRIWRLKVEKACHGYAMNAEGEEIFKRERSSSGHLKAMPKLFQAGSPGRDGGDSPAPQKRWLCLFVFGGFKTVGIKAKW